MLKQRLAEGEEYEQQVSERLARMDNQQQSLLETHRALQEAFQQVSTERGGGGLAEV